MQVRTWLAAGYQEQYAEHWDIVKDPLDKLWCKFLKPASRRDPHRSWCQTLWVKDHLLRVICF